MSPAEMTATLRRQALDQVPFSPDSADDQPYGVIVEFLQGDVVVTITAFSTGDASMYLSTGGGVIGGIGQPAVAKRARSIVSDVAPLVPQLGRSEAADPPNAGEYCFYVLTPSGRFVCRVNSAATVRKDGPEATLVRLCGPLVTLMRELAKAR